MERRLNAPAFRLPLRKEDKLAHKSYDLLHVTPAFDSAEARRLEHPLRFVLKAGDAALFSCFFLLPSDHSSSFE
jgi:hypothetical protein